MAGATSTPRNKKQPAPVYAFVSALPGAGKTTVACAAAAAMRPRRVEVGVFLPIAHDGRHDRTRWISSDAERLAHFADAPEDMPTVAPWCQSDHVPPSLQTVGRREDEPEAVRQPDFEDIVATGERIRQRADVLLVEVHGGLAWPISRRIDQGELLQRLGARLIIVGPANAAAFASLLMQVRYAQDRGLEVEAVVLNRFDPDRASRADETQADWIERSTRVPVVVSIPPGVGHEDSTPHLDPDVVSATRPLVQRMLRQVKGEGR